MTQALQTSATGINVGQQQINVIANNVANINTVAYRQAHEPAKIHPKKH